MKNKKIKNNFVLVVILIFILSTVSSFAVGEVLQKKNDDKNSLINLNRGVTFVSKSSGLEVPAKEGGKTELELADINNDGHLDVICVGDHGSPYINSNQHGIMVWLGDGEGTWSVIQVGNFGYGGIEAGDLNLDGYLDVVWGIHHDYSSTPGFGDTLIGAALGDGTGSNWIPWATGLGTGGEDYGMFSTDLADFDCNGLLDIISLSFGCCNGYHQYENHGDGTWIHTWALSGGNARNNLETGDFNADGYPDFAGLRENTYVFLGDGSFGFTMNQNGLPAGYYYGIDCGDMNYDGCDDLVIGLGSSGVCCFKFDKQNDVWVSASSGLPTAGTYEVQFGDIDGDGFLDILAYSDPTGYAYLGDGNGNWMLDGTFTMYSPGYYSALTVDGDFDHDGREDVLIQAEQGSWPSYQNVLKAYSPWFEPTELTAQVSIPHGGETFRSGSIRNIRWLSAVPPSQGDATVKIQVSLDGESGPWDTIASDIPNSGCFQWLVDVGGSEHCRIRIIVSTSSASASAISASDFTIIGFNVDAHGPYQGYIGEPIQFTGSAENGTPPYDFLWDFGDGDTSGLQNPTHIYDDAGNFTVILTVTDDDGITVRDSTWAFILGDNNPPSSSRITGPTSGQAGVEYTYCVINVTDPDGDDIWANFSWGDGSYSGWIGPNVSGEDICASHAWERGNYEIKVKLKDEWGLETDWSDPLPITMPKNKPFNFKFNMLSWLFERFPNAFPILRHMLGL